MGCNRQGQDITFKYPIVECEFRISCSAVGQFGFRAPGFQLIMGLRQAVGRCRYAEVILFQLFITQITIK